MVHNRGLRRVIGRDVFGLLVLVRKVAPYDKSIFFVLNMVCSRLRLVSLAPVQFTLIPAKLVSTKLVAVTRPANCQHWRGLSSIGATGSRTPELASLSARHISAAGLGP